MQTTRRQFIFSSAGAALGAALGAPLNPLAAAAATPPIGFQLYTLRGAFAKDVPGTLRALAQIGYAGVEFWGYGGTANVYQQYSATRLTQLLTDNGLKCCGMHLELKALQGDALARTIENNLTLGSRYLNVAAAEEKMKSESGIAELARILNAAAERCRAHQLSVGYHAHPFDFVKIGGRFAWELLFNRTQPEVNMQMDVGNCLAGRGDPLAMLRQFPGRARTVHIKEYQEKTFESDYYKDVFRLCEGGAATQWYIVEMGDDTGSGFEIPKQALAKLRQLGK